jgi:hypothetical protein
LNGLSKWRPQPTKAQLEQWALQEPKLIEEALRGDRRCGYKKKSGLLENKAARLLVERYVYTIQFRAWRAWRKVHPVRNFKKHRDLMPNRRRLHAVEIDDVIAAALERFWRAVRNFGTGANNGLFAYAGEWVDGAISDTMRDWRNTEGFTERDDTRLARFLRNEKHREWPLEIIKLKFPKYTLEEIAIKLEVSVTESYTEIAVIDENGDEQSTDDPLDAARSSAAPWSRHAALGYRWPKEHGLRNLHAFEQVNSARGGLAYGYKGKRVTTWTGKRRRIYGSLWNDRVWEHHDRKQVAKLNEKGRQDRQAYADYLINRPTTCPPFQIRQGELQQIQHDPVPFKSDKPNYWDARAPMVSVILAVDGKPVVRQRTRSKAWFAANYPRFRKTEIEIISDDPVTSCLPMEGLYVAEATTLVPSQGSQSTSGTGGSIRA